ncbi:MAG TPA: hypothetical protein VIS74_00785 [Chthoniobacterales bacterium]
MIRKTTPLGRLIYFLGSLNFALILLGTIAIACAVATIFESRFDTKVAQTYIYKAPWFVFWLGFLCVNLFCVTLTRWPWQKKHLGFVITHYGIITLLIGAVIGSKFGFEGNVTLHAGEPPANRLTTARSVIQLEGPMDRALYTLPFDAAAVRPSEKRPKRFGVPGTKWRIVADNYAPDLVRDPRLVKTEGGRPGLILKMDSRMAAQQLGIPLLLHDPELGSADLFGLAKIQWMESLPAHEPKRERETQVVFGNYAPIVQSVGGGSGIPIHLSKDGAELTIAQETYRRAEVMDRELTVGSAKVRPSGYWPDFVMQNGRPATQSQEPRNPAVMLQVDYEAAPPARGLALELAPGRGGVNYQFVRDGRIVSRGAASAGEEFVSGWMDWRVRVEEYEPSAALRFETRLPREGESKTGIPGFWARLETEDGARGEPRWVESGRLTELAAGEARVRIGYGLEIIKVSFNLKLLNFEVPRYEGTETPSDYISTLEFTDLRTGQSRMGVAKMNHPASWPGGFWAVTTGLNYKFSQAEWNPRDLGETTLQVLYDPGWLLKWTGSLAICIGIALMFYWRPKKA